jgi:hypothetical protein
LFAGADGFPGCFPDLDRLGTPRSLTNLEFDDVTITQRSESFTND